MPTLTPTLMQPSPLIQRRTCFALLALLLLLASALGLRADPRLSALAEGGTASLLEEGGITYVVHTFTTSGTFTVKLAGLGRDQCVAGGGVSVQISNTIYRLSTFIYVRRVRKRVNNGVTGCGN